MNIKELNQKLQFEFMQKHQKANEKSEILKNSLNNLSVYQKLSALERELSYLVAKNFKQ